MKTKIVTVIALLIVPKCGFAQNFVNLDFNSANIPNGTSPATFVPIGDAIPGWTGYLGNTQVTDVLYDSLAIGSVNISILDANSPAHIPGNNYTVVLEAGNGGGNGGLANTTASIAQTGLIPATVESIEFTASFPNGGAGWQITINGQLIPVSQIGTVGSYYGVYAGNVSAYAGHVDQLEFTSLYGPAGAADNLYLDNLAFSASPVPEPNSLGLFALGGMFVAWLHWRKPSPKVLPEEH